MREVHQQGEVQALPPGSHGEVVPQEVAVEEVDAIVSEGERRPARRAQQGPFDDSAQLRGEPRVGQWLLVLWLSALRLVVIGS